VNDQVQCREFAIGDSIRRRDNLAFVDESNLGKRHLIQSVGRCCCAHGYCARYHTSAELLEELTVAADDNTLPVRQQRTVVPFASRTAATRVESLLRSNRATIVVTVGCCR